MGSPAKRIQYRYDSRGNRQSMIDPDGGRFTYAYDARNRIQSVQNPQGERTTYSYDVRNRRTVMELANGTRTSYVYDAVSNLRRLSNLKSDGSVISDLQYRYDKTGNRTSVVEADGSRVTWSYDAASQLTGEFRTGPTAYRNTFAYDPAGNRTLKNEGGVRTTYSYDAANQLQWSQDASGRTTYTFDADGNQERVQAPDGSRTTTVWDYENRATSIQLPNGIRNTMAYDPQGLRVKLEESTGPKKFVWDDQNYLAETNGSNDTQVVYTNEPRIHGKLISQRRGSTTSWYHFDVLGSTRQLTDATQMVTDQRLYDAWGTVIANSGSTVFPFQYVGNVGYYSDSDHPVLYIRARYYQPKTGRWWSVDPLWSSLRLWFQYFAYFSPIQIIDPSGLQAEVGPCESCDDVLKRPPLEIEQMRQCFKTLGCSNDPFVCACCKQEATAACTFVNTNGEIVVRLCCGRSFADTQKTMVHEMVHALRICRLTKGKARNPVTYTDSCAECLAEELTARICGGQVVPGEKAIDNLISYAGLSCGLPNIAEGLGFTFPKQPNPASRDPLAVDCDSGVGRTFSRVNCNQDKDWPKTREKKEEAQNEVIQWVLATFGTPPDFNSDICKKHRAPGCKFGDLTLPHGPVWNS